MGSLTTPQKSDLGTRDGPRVHVARALLRAVALCALLTPAACGGTVIEPVDSQDDTDAATDGGSGGPVVLNGGCLRCDGEKECGFCLIQAFESTYICPVGHAKPSGGCMDLLESHTTLKGEPFTCFYCE